jgi:hypothetical protein
MNDKYAAIYGVTWMTTPECVDESCRIAGSDVRIEGRGSSAVESNR